MKSAFNREGKEIGDWNKVNKDLERELEIIRIGENIRMEELKQYLLDIIDLANVNEEHETAFWEYADPGFMPSDARCEYVYRPTCLMTLIMINIINRNSEFMRMAGVRETLRFALNACVGRNLLGAGYDAYEGLCSNILLFLENGIGLFMKEWPLFSIRFEEVFRNSINRIEKDYAVGFHKDGFGNDCEKTQKEIVKLTALPTL